MTGTFKKVIQFWAHDRSLSIFLLLLLLVLFVFYPLVGVGILSSLYLHTAASFLLVIGVLAISKYGWIAIFAAISAGASVVVGWTNYGLGNTNLFFFHNLLTATNHQGCRAIE
jgi:hypothetical protein